MKGRERECVACQVYVKLGEEDKEEKHVRVY